MGIRKKMKLGDKVESVIKKTGLHRFAPGDCGCAKRKDWLNGETTSKEK